MVGSTNHRIKRQIIEEYIYSLSYDGQDNITCLDEHNPGMNCQTVTFIINQRCHLDVLLIIRLEGNESYVFQEPLQNLNSNLQTRCRVLLEGIVSNDTKPVVDLKNSNSTNRNNNIFSLLLKESDRSCVPQSPSWMCHDQLSKLEMRNVSLKTMFIEFYGHKISFTDVDFSDIGLHSPANNNTYGCQFHCENCFFKPQTTQRYYYSSLQFEMCISGEIVLNHVTLQSTQMKVTFVARMVANVLEFKMINTQTRIIFEQKYVTHNLNIYQSSSVGVEVVMQNISCVDTSSYNFYFSNFGIEIYVLSPISNGSIVTVSNALLQRCSSFLTYRVDSVNGEEENNVSDHIITVDGVKTNYSHGIRLLSLTQVEWGSITVENCLFNNTNEILQCAAHKQQRNGSCEQV